VKHLKVKNCHTGNSCINIGVEMFGIIYKIPNTAN